MESRYLSTKSILKELGINSYQDYQFQVSEWVKMGKRLYRGSQLKIDSLRQIVVDDFQDLNREPLFGQYISIDPSQVQDIQMDNYMCIFPKRILVETDTLYTRYYERSTLNYDLPPNDYFKQFFRYEKLIKRNIIQLYPVGKGIFEHNVRETFDSVLGFSPITPLENVVQASQGRDISEVVHRVDYFYAAFPWLYNANTDVYLEIVDDYPAEFENLVNTIEKISCASKNCDDFNANVLKDLRDALINIQIAFDQKRLFLKSKGIPTVLGLILTYIPLAIPTFFDNFDPKIYTGIIGTVTLAESRNLLAEFFSLKNEGIKNPFWVVWKWKDKTS